MPGRGSSSTREPSRTDWLWQYLTERFGHRLHSAYGHVPPTAWRAQLDELTPEQWQRGIECLRSRHRVERDERRLGWPPTLDEFLHWCTTEPPPPAPEHREFPPLALPEPEEARQKRLESGKSHIAAMQALLRSKGARSARPATTTSDQE